MYNTRRGALLSGLGLLSLSANAVAKSSDGSPAYKFGDVVPVTCLNRTETGEHITDSTGALQYIPFQSCAETSLPLSLIYASTAPIKCTITIDDPLFHLFEYYIHNDVPLSCRVPSLPSSPDGLESKLAGSDRQGAMGSDSTAYTPLVIALSGTLQLSHLHVANEVNVVLHTASPPSSSSGKNKPGKGKQTPEKEKEEKPDSITTASAYSLSPHTLNQKIIIGTDLILTFHPRWYVGAHLPLTNLASHHSGFSTAVYMLLSALVSATLCVVYFRGVELPRRLRWHGVHRVGGSGRGGDGGLPVYKGYGYNVGAAGAGASSSMAVNGYGNGSAGGGGYGGYGFGVSSGGGGSRGKGD